MTLTEELIDLISSLPEEKQRRVLDYAQSLQRDKITDPKDLIALFAGTISHEDAEEMRQAIEEDCERIYPGEW